MEDNMLDNQQTPLFTELTPSEEESFSGGGWWSDVKNWVKDKAKYVGIGVGVGLGGLALFTGGQPTGKYGDPTWVGGKWKN
jgi:hypothetical protein